MNRRAYFLTDLHLGANYAGPRIDREREVVEFLRSIESDCAELYLLGDVLDYWYEYRYVVPRGYVRFFGQLARMSDLGVRIVWIIGNHDIWIFDYLPKELGIAVVDGVYRTRVLGSTPMLMAHGDGQGLKTWKFRVIRHLFRSRLCQRLFSSIQPRWTVPFAHAWSGQSRESGLPDPGDLKAEAARQRGLKKYMDRLQAFCEEYIADEKSIDSPPPDYFLFGHLHQAERRRLSDGSEMVVLGSWIDTRSYAIFDGTALTLHQASQACGLQTRKD